MAIILLHMHYNWIGIGIGGREHPSDFNKQLPKSLLVKHQKMEHPNEQIKVSMEITRPFRDAFSRQSNEAIRIAWVEMYFLYCKVQGELKENYFLISFFYMSSFLTYHIQHFVPPFYDSGSFLQLLPNEEMRYFIIHVTDPL